LRIWEEARPAPSTIIESYFHARGLLVTTPSAIRFHPGLGHPSGGTWPAIVALVTFGSDHNARAVHRTYLLPCGSGKALVQPQKMMLGPCRGGAVRLAAHNGTLMVGEGIETCLAAMQATGYPAWAALSTTGLRTLGLPAEVRDVVVLADGDDPGETAARDAALRWKHEGRRVRIARPPRGFDFNDMLMGKALCHGKDVT
jgi:putative DNA primase/helicase